MSQAFTDELLARARLSGQLQKCDGGFFSFNNKRWFGLTDNALYLFLTQPDRGDQPEAGILLTYASCTDSKHKDKKEHTLCVVTLDTNHFFQATDNTELWKWITAIGEAIQACTPREHVDFKTIAYP